MRWPNSLRERLALAALLVTAISLAALAFGFNVVLSRQLRSGADDLLHTRAAVSAGNIDINPDGSLTLGGPPEERPISSATWIYEGRTAIERSSGDRDQQRTADALAGSGERTAQTREPEAVRFYALPLLLGDRQVGTVISSIGLDPYTRVEKVALFSSMAAALLVLGGAYLLTRTLVGRALTPVAQMTAQAARWSSSDLERRFGTGARPTELAALAATLDGVLDRLAAVLRHEQQLSAQLSHELRTPLTAMVAEIELLDSRPRSQAELREGHAAVLAATDRMSRVLESLLTAERATADDTPGRCAVLPAVRAAVDSVDPPAGVVTVRERTAKLYAGVDHALLERALAPVLDNALRYCRTKVVVEIGRTATGPEVTVCDDGPGVPPELADRVFEPGVRSPDGHEGSGLGLALARRLVRAGGGELQLRPDGVGARFVLSLPTA